LSPARWPQFDSWLWPALVGVTIVVLVPGIANTPANDNSFITAVVVLFVAVSIVLFRNPTKSAFAVAVAFIAILIYPTGESRIETLRSFFGVHKIYETDDGRFRILKHGSTIHGAQMIAEENGDSVTGRPRAITYYHDDSAINQVIQTVRWRKAAPLRTAVIGLGAGSLTCRIEPGES